MGTYTSDNGPMGELSARALARLDERVADALHRAEPDVRAGESREGDLLHAVRLYDSDDELFEHVGGYLSAALDGDIPIVVIATPSHRAGFVDALRKRGHEVERAEQRGLAVFLDAATTLPDNTGATWRSGPATSPWVQVAWSAPREVSAVQVYGAAA